MSFSTQWLQDPTAIKILLVEIYAFSIEADLEVPFYFSTSGYLTSDASVYFKPGLSSQFQIRESLSTSNSISISYGDIEIDNSKGDFDSLLDPSKYVWSNRPVKVYLGSSSWLSANLEDFKSKFLLVFDGVVQDIDAKDRYSINFKVRDKLQKLNVSVTELKIGEYGTWAGGQQNNDNLKPVCIGEVFNIEPVLIDPAPASGASEFMLSSNPIERLIELRDNGTPVYNASLVSGATVDLANAKFTLAKPLAGTCTATLQGIKGYVSLSPLEYQNAVYYNDILNAVLLLATQYGTLDSVVGLAELDVDNLLEFKNNNPYPVGIYLDSRENLLSLITRILASVGAQIIFNRFGKLQIKQLGVYTSDPIAYINKSDIVQGTFNVRSRTGVVASHKLAYSKNYTVQSGLLTAIPQGHKDNFETEWSTTTSSNDPVKSLYKLNIEPTQKETVLIREQDAQAEARRLTDYYSTPRTVYSMRVIGSLLLLNVGQEVVLKFDRFGLNEGKSGQVISTAPNWVEGTNDIEVII